MAPEAVPTNPATTFDDTLSAEDYDAPLPSFVGLGLKGVHIPFEPGGRTLQPAAIQRDIPKPEL